MIEVAEGIVLDDSFVNPMIKIENAEIYQKENILDVCLMYPRDNPINTVYLDLCDVRCTTPIKITYDFDRNGWQILSQTKFNEKQVRQLLKKWLLCFIRM